MSVVNFFCFLHARRVFLIFNVTLCHTEILFLYVFSVWLNLAKYVNDDLFIVTRCVFFDCPKVPTVS